MEYDQTANAPSNRLILDLILENMNDGSTIHNAGSLNTLSCLRYSPMALPPSYAHTVSITGIPH